MLLQRHLLVLLHLSPARKPLRACAVRGPLITRLQRQVPIVLRGRSAQLVAWPAPASRPPLAADRPPCPASRAEHPTAPKADRIAAAAVAAAISASRHTARPVRDRHVHPAAPPHATTRPARIQPFGHTAAASPAPSGRTHRLAAIRRCPDPSARDDRRSPNPFRRIRSAQQHRRRQQHVRDRTRPAPCPPRRTRSIEPLHAMNRPWIVYVSFAVAPWLANLQAALGAVDLRPH